jgi:uncharacterized protein involved in exopolysaccharide biosynthesis
VTLTTGRSTTPLHELTPLTVPHGSATAHVVGVLRRYRLLLAGLPLLIAFVVGVVGLMETRTYTAAASFTPSTAQSPGGSLTSLAEQFGVSVRAGGSASQSPAFYGDLVRSRSILEPVVGTAYPTATGAPPRPLPDLLEVPAGAPPALRTSLAMARLGQRMAVSVKRETGVVSFAVTTPWPELSSAIATRILTEVDRFNLETRQSQAKAQRRFVGDRLTQARGELRTLEDRRLSYAQQNRDASRGAGMFGGGGAVTQSSLVLQRMDAELRSREQVVNSLAQAYEQARIDEVRDTPAITVVEAPVPPARPDPRGLVRRVGMALVLGFGFAVTLAFGREWWRGLHSELANGA